MSRENFKFVVFHEPIMLENKTSGHHTKHVLPELKTWFDAVQGKYLTSGIPAKKVNKLRKVVS